MHLKFLLSLLFIFFYTCSITAQNKIKWISWDNLPEKIEKGNKKFMVYFYYDGCKWCKVMEETTFNSDHIAKFVNQNFFPLKLNALSSGKIAVADKLYSSVRIGKYDFHELAVELLSGNMSFPAVVFLDEKFHKVVNFDSYLDVGKFEMVLSFYGGDHYKNTMWKRFEQGYCRDSHFNSLVNDKR